MKHSRPRTARTDTVKHLRAGTVRHTQKQAALHKQIKASRPIHHKIMLHPLSALSLLAVGVLIVGWTLGVAADAYNVTAKVPAPPLATGAVITDPTDNSATQVSPITATGTCPDNSYIKLSRNGAFSGVAWCVANSFSIQTALSSGTNLLIAQDYSITDDPGPATAGVTVTYTPPAPLSSSASSAASPSTPGSNKTPEKPLLIASDYHFQAFISGSTFSWTVDVDGGVAPYTVETDWGDTKTSVQAVLGPQPVTITHTYAQPGYYPIVVRLTDAKNAATVLQLAALVKQPEGANLFGPTSGSTNAPSQTPITGILLEAKDWLWLAWPAYLTLVLMAISFWLGERQELERLIALSRTHHLRPRHR